ncbi:MAG: GGDEF domain-containing protein, partial [Mesorhizobium sp.]
LSRLLNRGGFERHAELAMRDAVRRGIPVALVIADLDHFKSINDSFGHASGDRVIEAFAGFLRDAAAEHHVAGRIGGEEFAIIDRINRRPAARCRQCRAEDQRQGLSSGISPSESPYI